MSETRDLGVPILVVLAGLGVLAWDFATGSAGLALLAAAVGAIGGGGSLRLTLRKEAFRSTFLAMASLLLLAALSPPFAGSRMSWLPWAIASLGLALHLRRLPIRARAVLLGCAVALVALAAFAALSGRANLRPLTGVALGGAFACAVSVYTARPRPEAPPPVGPTIGVFGGSFDPFHAGHRAICEASLKVTQRLLLVVAARPPHKQGMREPTPFHHRVAMARLGTEGLPRIEVVELEGRRVGPSYTVDTLEALRRLYPPGTKFRLIIGSDSLQDFPLWHDWEGILERADLLVAARPGTDLEPPPEFEGRNAPITTLGMGAFAASSTEIRRRIAVGESTGDLLTPAVAAYVRDHGLYREGATPSAEGTTDADAPGGPDAPPELPPDSDPSEART